MFPSIIHFVLFLNQPLLKSEPCLSFQNSFASFGAGFESALADISDITNAIQSTNDIVHAIPDIPIVRLNIIIIKIFFEQAAYI